VVVLSHPTWNEPFEFGPVLPEALFSIPVKYAYATGMQLRHADVPSDLTEVFSTVPSATDSKVSRRGVIPAGAAGTMQFVVQRTVRDRQLFFLLEPLGVIANWLPCTLHVRFRYGEAKQQRAPEEEEVALVPGQKFKVVRGNVKEAVSMSFRVGSFDWSPFVPFRDSENKHKRRDIGFSYGGDSTDLVVSVKNHVDEDTGAVDCVVFSKFALVDRTGLELAIKGKSIASSGNVVRNSFARTSESEEKSAAPIARLDSVSDLCPVFEHALLVLTHCSCALCVRACRAACPGVQSRDSERPDGLRAVCTTDAGACLQRSCIYVDVPARAVHGRLRAPHNDE
jgi:hypothetical protein